MSSDTVTSSTARELPDSTSHTDMIADKTNVTHDEWTKHKKKYLIQHETGLHNFYPRSPCPGAGTGAPAELFGILTVAAVESAAAAAADELAAAMSGAPSAAATPVGVGAAGEMRMAYAVATAEKVPWSDEVLENLKPS